MFDNDYHHRISFFLAGFVAEWAGSFINSYQHKFLVQWISQPSKIKVGIEKKDAAKRAKEEKEANKLRESQAKNVAEFVRKRFSGYLFDTEHFVVAGDFNDTHDSPHLKN